MTPTSPNRFLINQLLAVVGREVPSAAPVSEDVQLTLTVSISGHAPPG